LLDQSEQCPFYVLRKERAVATYEYQCDRDGVFDVVRPLGTAPASVVCTQCGGEARRIVSAPVLRSASRTAWNAAIDHAEKSRYEPEVVASPPRVSGGRVRTVPLTPKLRGLPRP
jgi:putative FmdB family regulatory protein